MFQMTNSKGKILLLKAPADDQEKDPYEKILEEEGYNVNMVPVLEFQFSNEETLITRMKSPDEYDGMIITSKRAAEAVKNVILIGPV